MNGSRVAFGVRAMLVTGQPSPQLADERMKLATQQATVLDLIESIEEATQRGDSVDEYSRQLTIARETTRETARKIESLDHKRVGVQVGLAGTAIWSFPNDTFDDGNISKWSVWLTPSYRVSGRDGPAAEFIAVLRWTHDRSTAPAGDLAGDAMPMLLPERDVVDIGFRGIWNANDRLSLSFESLHRERVRRPCLVMKPMVSPNTSNRTVGILEYRLADSSYLYGSFGKDFAEAGLPAGLVSVLGVSIGLGEKPVISIR